VAAPLRVGRIRYTNDLPIYAAFDEGAVSFPGVLHADVPARLNAMLIEGELDLSPISAFHFAAHADELAMLPDLCIGSRREVWSVLLVSPEPPGNLDGVTIAVTKESASGRNLLRVLLERRFGVRANFAPSDDPYAEAAAGNPALLIGDRAIDARENLAPERVYDLGKLWNGWTQTDMVFALWAVRRDVMRDRPGDVHAAMDAFEASYRWSLANKDRVIAAAERVRPRSPGFYAAYYETLNFSFDAQARVGLARYFAELGTIGAIPRVPSAEPEAELVTR